MSVAVQKILYAADAKESALSEAQEYLGQTTSTFEAEAEAEAKDEDEVEAELEAKAWCFGNLLLLAYIGKNLLGALLNKP